MTHEHDKPARMFIVARRHAELYEYLNAQFADDGTVRVVLDRRLASRRRRALPAAAERRRLDRRARPEVDEQLRATPLAIVIASDAAPPRSVARQFVETMQREVSALRGALDERDRLRQESLAIKQENEQLRSDMDLSWKELAEVDSTIARAIAIVSDIHARLREEPGPAR